jgi:alginate O-acetyltransferase complex protein AlgI
MARALAAVFGFEIPRNFERPYFAASPREFWRRWHISLSTWLRDYLYIPLGGNRRRLVLNLMITMLLGGLWHGARWTFVVWGAMHGLLLVVQHLASRRSVAAPTTGTSTSRILSWLATQLAVLAAWIVFRSADLPTAAVAMRKFLLFDFDFHLRHQGLGGLLFATTVLILVAFAAVHTWSWRRGDLDVRLANAPAPILAAACILLGALFIAFWPSEGQPFIYFQF